MIEVKELHKRYGPVEVLKGVDIRFEKGEITAILGPNGSGKTTLMKSILGMVIPQSGEVLIDNEAVLGHWEYRDKISYVPQIANFPGNLKVLELIQMIRDIRPGAQNHEDLIDMFKLQPFLNKRLAALSGGTRQKVNLVLALMFDAPIIILDEPMAGLDPVALILLKKLIAGEKAKGKTILLTTHIITLVEEIADKVAFLLDGTVYFFGPVNELKDKTKQPDLEHAIAAILKESYA
ncbi:MAG TPA: ABC transporter ATP-binding protein [Caldithrix abyssi]|uniref:ABC transporter ATP-binding protein n=1 Tax=Caldithrix abyssi TaxID=187145 RepID=A0A7V4U1H8_CALAY|nr:ABC transporter ATP-binding protein [Caldithrix abyssi]